MNIQPVQISVDAFKRLVREGVQDACKAQGWNEAKEGERGYAFQKWVGELLIKREGLDADIDEGMFLSGDLMIDVALEDSDRKLLYLIQTKYVSLAQSPPIPEDEVVSFLDRHSVLHEHQDWVRSHANDQFGLHPVSLTPSYANPAFCSNSIGLRYPIVECLRFGL